MSFAQSHSQIGHTDSYEQSIQFSLADNLDVMEENEKNEALRTFSFCLHDFVAEEGRLCTEYNFSFHEVCVCKYVLFTVKKKLINRVKQPVRKSFVLR